jgi:YopX protein.
MEQRIIKFKAKSIYNNEWVYGDLLHKADGTYIFIGKGENGHILCPKVDPSTVCQFTGLEDSEGKEIWEGDILLNTNSGSQYAVMYSDYGGAFFIRKNGTVNDDMYLFEISDVDKCIAFIEVIGNKFDKEN